MAINAIALLTPLVPLPLPRQVVVEADRRRGDRRLPRIEHAPRAPHLPLRGLDDALVERRLAAERPHHGRVLPRQRALLEEEAEPLRQRRVVLAEQVVAQAGDGGGAAQRPQPIAQRARRARRLGRRCHRGSGPGGASGGGGLAGGLGGIGGLGDVTEEDRHLVEVSLVAVGPPFHVLVAVEPAPVGATRVRPRVESLEVGVDGDDGAVVGARVHVVGVALVLGVERRARVGRPHVEVERETVPVVDDDVDGHQPTHLRGHLRRLQPLGARRGVVVG